MENSLILEQSEDFIERTEKIAQFTGFKVILSSRIIKVTNFSNSSIIGYCGEYKVGRINDNQLPSGEIYLDDINKFRHTIPFLEIASIEIIQDFLVIANFKERGLGTYIEGSNDPDFEL